MLKLLVVGCLVVGGPASRVFDSGGRQMTSVQRKMQRRIFSRAYDIDVSDSSSEGPLRDPSPCNREQTPDCATELGFAQDPVTCAAARPPMPFRLLNRPRLLCISAHRKPARYCTCAGVLVPNRGHCQGRNKTRKCIPRRIWSSTLSVPWCAPLQVTLFNVS